MRALVLTLGLLAASPAQADDLPPLTLDSFQAFEDQMCLDREMFTELCAKPTSDLRKALEDLDAMTMENGELRTTNGGLVVDLDAANAATALERRKGNTKALVGYTGGLATALVIALLVGVATN